MAPPKAFTLALALASVSAWSAQAFVPSPRAPAPSVVLPRSRPALAMGLLDDIFGKETADKRSQRLAREAQREAEREAAFQAQQALLAKRQATGGRITDEDEAAIFARRKALVSDGERELQQLQQRYDGSDKLSEWKALRDSGRIQTASKGMKRDTESSRLGSAGLLEDRADAKLPYIDEGYVDEGADVMGGLKRLFGLDKDKSKDQ